MKHTLRLLCLVITLCCAVPAKAQKAYTTITYRTSIDGNQATLQLTDGYLLASKVTIRSKFGNQVFSPAADEADAQGDFKLDASRGTGKFKHNSGSWLTLKKMNGPDYPTQIKAVYWDGKVQKTVIFKQMN